MKTIAYLRVSTDMQDLNVQKLTILEYAQKNKISIDEFIEIQISSRKSMEARKIHELIGGLTKGDRIIVSELSRLGRSISEIIRIVDELNKNTIQLIAIKENIVLSEHYNIQNKMMVVMFGLFAEIERELISERTKVGLMAARNQGKLLGRRKGALGKSKLDGKVSEIEFYLEKRVPVASIAKILEVSRSNLQYYISSRKIKSMQN
jgi:DNA invertase Pin-like site-specific DNA recombinase